MGRQMLLADGVLWASGVHRQVVTVNPSSPATCQRSTLRSFLHGGARLTVVTIGRLCRRRIPLLVLVSSTAFCPSILTAPLRAQQAVKTSGSRHWVVLGRTGDLTAYIAATGRSSLPIGQGRIWFRFVWDSARTFATDAPPYRAIEVYEDLDCSKKVVRDLAMRVEQITGRSVPGVVDSTEGRHFKDHPLGQEIFLRACLFLDRRHSSSAHDTD